MHLADGVGQVGHALQGKVFALHGHDHAIGGAQAVEGEHAQRGWAVDQHKVVFASHRRQRGFQAALALLQRDQLHLGPGQLAVGTQHIEGAAVLGQVGGAHPRFAHAG